MSSSIVMQDLSGRQASCAKSTYSTPIELDAMGQNIYINVIFTYGQNYLVSSELFWVAT